MIAARTGDITELGRTQMTNAARRLPLGLVPPQVKEHLYYSTAQGHLHALSKVRTTTLQLPFHGVIALTRNGSPLKVSSAGHTVESSAIAMCARTLHLEDSTDVLMIITNPLHENFRLFSRIAEPGVIPLDRTMFDRFEGMVDEAFNGALTPQRALKFFNDVQDGVRAYLPALPELDERARILVKELWANPRCSVNDLAQHLGLSYHRTSHLFTDSVGIAMRTYQLWQKLYRAASALLAGTSLTEAAHVAGFVDSAHYSSAFQRAYGRPPSHVYRNPRVAIYSAEPISSARQAEVIAANL
jgi:AraC-like DNA-binding protein